MRRLGFGFVAFAMVLQMFAVMAPPEKSLAASNDYIINGLRNRDDILRAWDGQTSDKNVAAIYSRFGLTREDIAALPWQPNVTLNSCHTDYWTMGRTSLSAVSKSSKIKQQYKNSEVAVNYGGGSVFLRQLKAWDIVNNCNTYRAFEGWKNGKQFWILVDCGNFTQVGPPQILKNPALELRKTIEGGPRTLKPGESFTFNFEYRNTVPESVPVEEVMLEDDLDLRYFEVTKFEYPLFPGANIKQFLHYSATTNLKSFLSLPLGRASYTPNYKTAARITVKLKQNLAHGSKFCNAAKLRSLRNNVAEAWSGGNNLCINVNNSELIQMCDKNTGRIVTIEKRDSSNSRYAPTTDPACQTCPHNPAIKANSARCQPPCPYDADILETDKRCILPTVNCYVTTTNVNLSTKEYTLNTKVDSDNKHLTTVVRYEYDFGDKSGVKRKNSSAYTDQEKHVYPEGDYTGTVTVYYKTGRGTAQKDASKACGLAVSSKPDKPLTQEKTARNLTQKKDETETLSSKAKAGDIVEYSLITKNTYDYDRLNVNVSDDISDILDYADLDKAFLSSQGGSYDEATKTISWKPQTAKAQANLVNKFRVKLKDPLPSTNQPGAMTTAYDCKISNAFGDQIDILIDCPLPKRIEETTSTTLPKTGPGSSLIIGFTATTIIAYFFARSRLLSKELELIQIDFAHTGGI